MNHRWMIYVVCLHILAVTFTARARFGWGVANVVFWFCFYQMVLATMIIEGVSR